MLDKRCDYALNRLDKAAIVCQSVTGEHIRLTQEDFASEEEFNRWKAWSDEDYHRIQLAGRRDDDCLSFEEQLDTPTPSAEDIFFAPLLMEDQRKKDACLFEQVKAILTEKQYRRLCLYYLDGKGEAEIAELEGVNQSSISRSISSSTKLVEKFFKKFIKGTA